MQIIFLIAAIVVMVVVYASIWDDYWVDRARNEHVKINQWLAKYGISMNFRDGEVGPFEKVVFFMSGHDVKFAECKGIGFRKAYKQLAQIREWQEQEPENDQTGNLMSLLYLSQAKAAEKTIWED